MYFKPDTEQYFSGHSAARDALKANVSLPASLTDELLAAHGIYPLADTRPDYSPITHTIREAAPAHIDGQWQKQWDVVALDSGVAEANASAEIAARKSQMLAAVNAKRDSVLGAGMPYTFGESADVVQTRPQDQVNLLIIRGNAQDAMAAGITDPVLEFRAESDVSYWLTPQQVLDMTAAARRFGYENYKASWALKTQILEAADMPALNGINITTGWPQ